MSGVTCFYDGHCGMCRRSTVILRRLDWLRRLDFVDVTTLDPDLGSEIIQAAGNGMPVRNASGKLLIGFPGVRHAMLQTPLGFVPALILMIPGISHLAALRYKHIANNRSRDACAMPLGDV